MIEKINKINKRSKIKTSDERDKTNDSKIMIVTSGLIDIPMSLTVILKEAMQINAFNCNHDGDKSS